MCTRRRGLVLATIASWTLSTLAHGQESPAAPRSPQRVAVEAAIRQAVEEMRFGDGLEVADRRVAAGPLLADLYEERGFAPAWGVGDDESILRAVEASVEDGLDPEDYHRSALRAMQRRLRDPAVRTPTALAGYDLLLSDAVARRVYHLEFGKVSARDLDPHWNMTREIDDLEPVVILQQIVAADSAESAILAHRPPHAIYRRGLVALARYRRIRDEGGWEPVPDGPKLELGATGPRVTALRARLAATGDLPRGDEGGAFDSGLEQAVERFQARHGLEADGVAGKGTLAELNVPVDARIDQIRVNLERARWVLHDLSGDFLLVDIAGFELRLFRDDQIVWTTRVQVGRPFRATPVFRSRIRYLDFNPTWTIPPGILHKDTLPAVQRDPTYLSERNIRVIDGDGNEVSSSAVDWSRYPAAPFPYRLVQDPGPSNALGLVKFMFPNEHLVFLHDTPSRGLFDRTERAFSSGCIRVEQPFELARLLLNDPQEWSAEAITGVVDSRETRTVLLPEPEPVILLYWTVDLVQEGRVGFKRDLYARDAPLLEALSEDFALHARP
jgi:murein L,D-transpeptidase YcbB/YkuD